MKLFPQAYVAIFRRYPTLGLIGVVSFLATAGWAVIIPTLPLYLAVELNIPPGMIGFIFGAYAVSETLAKTPLGVIGDHTGRKSVAVAGLILAFGVPVTMLFAYHPLHFIALQVINGLSIAAFWPTMAALTTDLVAPEHRATALTIYNASYLTALGLAPPAGIFLSHLAQTNQAPLLAAALLTSLALLLAMFLPRPEKSHQPRPISWRQLLARACAGGLPAQLRFIRSSKPLAFLLGISILEMFAVGLLAPIFVLFIKQDLGFSEAAISRAILVPIVTVALAALPLGQSADRIGYSRAARIAFLVGALGIILMPLAHHLWLLTVLIGLLGLAYVLGAPAWTALASALAPSANRGTAIAALSTMQSLGFVLGPPTGGCLYQIAGCSTPFLVCGGLLLLCVFLIAILIPSSPVATSDNQENKGQTA